MVRKGSPRVLDMGSVNVLVRATLESALVFHHLFVSPQDAAEAELRYLSWVLADLVERQAVPASLPQSQETQREERSQIDQMSAQLQANSEFQKLTRKQQKRVLEDGYWSPGWSSVARAAGLSELHATLVHRYLSSYAHSGGLSILQLRFPKTQEDREALLAAALELVSIALAVMTQGYCSAFPKAAEALRQQPRAMAKVEDWIRIGGGEDGPRTP